jgi:integrase
VKSINKQINDRQREIPMKGRSKFTDTLRLSGDHWTPHDLRRTAATIMGHCGVLSEIIERCLNHVEASKLKRTYQRQEPRQQMQEAWELLGQRLEALLSDGNVTVVNFGIKVA